MAKPTTREEFKDHTLRALGWPTINIEVTDEQIDDRIDEALEYFYDYHFTGSEKTYYKVQVTEQIKTDGYITLPDNIRGAVKIFPLGSSINSSNMFSITYQFALNDLYALVAQSLVPFYMSMQNIAMIEELLVGQVPIRFNRHRNRLHIDMNWDKVNIDDYIIVEAYEVVDPATFVEAWADRWLQRYAQALVQRQWGMNLSKFAGMQMPGGTVIDGVRILRDAKEQIDELEAKMITDYSPVLMHFIG